LREGRKATLAKEYEEARTAFTRCIDVSKANGRAISERGYAAMLANQLELAEADFDDARRLTTDSKLLAQIWFNIGLVREKHGEIDNALVAFSQSYQLSPSKAAKDHMAAKPVPCKDANGQAAKPGTSFPNWASVYKHLAQLSDKTPNESISDEWAKSELTRLRRFDKSNEQGGAKIVGFGDDCHVDYYATLEAGKEVLVFDKLNEGFCSMGGGWSVLTADAVFNAEHNTVRYALIIEQLTEIFVPCNVGTPKMGNEEASCGFFQAVKLTDPSPSASITYSLGTKLPVSCNVSDGGVSGGEPARQTVP
jgi:tetratricopeptide (TPR) repeat protein